MLILKIVFQILNMLVTWWVAKLDYSWHDKRTSRFKKGRYRLYVLLPTLLVISVSITILDDREKGREIKELTSKLDDINNQLTGGDTYAYFTLDPSRGEGDPPVYPLAV